MAGYKWSDAELEALKLPFSEFRLKYDRTWHSYRAKCLEVGVLPRKEAPPPVPYELAERLRKLVRNGPIDQYAACEQLNVTPVQLAQAVAALADEQSVAIEILHGQLWIPPAAAPRYVPTTTLPVKEPELIRFGVVADTHMSSTAFQGEVLEWLYDRFEREGITSVLHAGDLTAAESVYNGQRYEVTNIGFDRQLSFAVDTYPRRSGIRTLGIGGNHDEDYRKSRGVDFMRAFERRRDDFTMLGWYRGRVRLGDLEIELWHGAGGGAYAMSYNSQKAIASMPGGSKPEILVVGHYHNMLEFFDRNVYAIHPGCTEGPTMFSQRRRLEPALGGVIVEAEMEPSDARPGRTHTLRAVNARFLRFYLNSEGRAV